MEEKKEVWNVTCNRFVAFLDILGFKDRLQRDGHEKVGEMLESLRPAIKIMEEMANRKLKNKRVKSSSKKNTLYTPSFIFPVMFSDSIIGISSHDTYTSALQILTFTRFIMYQAIGAGIPIKGAIAYGEFTADLDKSLYFGKPLIDAYELQNELQIYGVALHHTAEKYQAENDMIKEFKDFLIINRAVPMKSGSITHYILDWVSYYSDDEKDVLNAVNELYKNVSGKPRMYVDNTLDFVREMLAKKKQPREIRPLRLV
jgi:hypothetical protein